MPPDTSGLYRLPNEIIVSILCAFTTEALLPLVTVSRRFHSIILRILHYRLLLAAELPDHELILDAYHPSQRRSDPFLLCTYLGTDGLSSKLEGKGSLYEDCPDARGRLAKLGALYSRFRPERPGRPPADSTPNAPSSPTASSTTLKTNAESVKPIHTLQLDGDELFGQFCAYADLVRLGPRRGMFTSSTHIVQSGQGVMRVWKQWLQDRARDLWASEQHPGDGHGPARPAESDGAAIGFDKTVMWTDYRKNVGLRVAIRDQDGTCYRQDRTDLDDLPMSFSIEIQELVVRSTHLMLAVEASRRDLSTQAGRTLVFGSFTTAPA